MPSIRDFEHHPRFRHIDDPANSMLISAVASYNATLTTRGWNHTFYTGSTRFDVYPSGYGHMTQLKATSGTNDDAGFFNSNFSAAQFRWSDEFDQTWLIRSGAVITNLRYTIGLGTADPTSDTYTGHFIVFRYSSAADAGQWQALTNDNTGQALTAMGAIDASTVYILRIRKRGLMVYFSLNGGPDVEVTSKVPSSGQPFLIFRVTTTGGAVAHDLDFGRFVHDYGNAAV